MAEYLYEDYQIPLKYQPALHRTIIGRIYYALLLEIRDHFGFAITKDDDSIHAIVTDAITDRKAKNKFMLMKKLRKDADYNLEKMVLVDHCMQQIEYYQIIRKIMKFN